MKRRKGAGAFCGEFDRRGRATEKDAELVAYTARRSCTVGMGSQRHGLARASLDGSTTTLGIEELAVTVQRNLVGERMHVVEYMHVGAVVPSHVCVHVSTLS